MNASKHSPQDTPAQDNAMDVIIANLKTIDSILDLAGFQIFPAGANKDRLKAKKLLEEYIASSNLEARDELNRLNKEKIGKLIYLFAYIDHRIERLTLSQKEKS